MASVLHFAVYLAKRHVGSYLPRAGIKPAPPTLKGRSLNHSDYQGIQNDKYDSIYMRPLVVKFRETENRMMVSRR